MTAGRQCGSYCAIIIYSSEGLQNIREKHPQTRESDIHILEACGPGGCDIILLHGMKFQAETWRRLNSLEKLAAAGHYALTVDMPGFGRSSASIEQPESVLHEVLGRQKFIRPLMLGPSMGGPLLLEDSRHLLCRDQQGIFFPGNIELFGMPFFPAGHNSRG